MHTSDALLDLHERSHRSLMALLVHCRSLTDEERRRRHEGFGYPSVHLQLHHLIGAQEYWIRVLVPAHVFIRTLTHIYHHQGQVVAMCRLLGKPAAGLDYPLA